MTERLEVAIRAAEPDDYDDIATLFSGPNVQASTLRLPYPSMEGWRRRLESSHDNTYRLVATVEETIVGMVGLRVGRERRRHSGEIGLAVRDDYQGRGVGSALLSSILSLAEQWLGLTRIELTVYTDNDPAIALYKRHNFVVEGTLRRYALRDGVYVDAYLMARICGG